MAIFDHLEKGLRPAINRGDFSLLVFCLRDMCMALQE